MFQCKDLLTLPSMAKARIIAGKSGLSNRIRWVYKPENMNFAKWVKTANAIPGQVANFIPTRAILCLW